MKRVLLCAALLSAISLQGQASVFAENVSDVQSNKAIVSPLTQSADSQVQPVAVVASSAGENEKTLQNVNSTTPDSSKIINVSEKIKTGVSKDDAIELKLKEEAPPKENVLKTWVKSDRATGNWHGLRGKLEDHGLSFEGYYYMDTMLKTRGGKDERAGGNKAMLFPYLYYGATLDTEKAKMWKGGTFYTAAELYGKTGLSLDEVGDWGTVSSLDGYLKGNQLTQYWYQQTLFDNHLRVKVGRDSTFNEFDSLASGLNFVNFGFNVNPMLEQAHLIPATPYSGFGVLTEVKPTENTSLKAGVYEGTPRTGTQSPKSFFNGDGGYAVALETAYTPTIKDHSGKYYLGSYINTKGWTKINGDETQTNKGIYLGMEQKVTNEKNDSSQGLTVFSRFGKAPSDRNYLTATYSLGATYTGLIPKRDADIFGVGWYYANLSRTAKNISLADEGIKMHDEKALELFYSFAVTPWFSIQPDFQYIAKPGGTGRNATLFGLRTVFTF